MSQLVRIGRTAAKVSADRGRYEPSRDALLHLGVVDPVDAGGPVVQIAIGFAAPGLPTPQGHADAVVNLPPKPLTDGD